MGGFQVSSTGSGDDGYDEDGFDESQRAEILEATRDGPSDGTILTDLSPDVDAENDDDTETEDVLQMRDGEVGEEDPDAAIDESDLDEDDMQDDLDDDSLADDDELSDEDDVALRP